MGDFVLYLFKKNKQSREELSSFFHHLLPRYPRFALSPGPSAAKPFLKEANLSPHEPPLEWRGGGFKHWLNCSSTEGGCAGSLQIGQFLFQRRPTKQSSLAQKNWFAKVKSARLRRDSRGQTPHHGRGRKITQGEEPKLNAPALEPAQSTVGESD